MITNVLVTLVNDSKIRTNNKFYVKVIVFQCFNMLIT